MGPSAAARGASRTKIESSISGPVAKLVLSSGTFLLLTGAGARAELRGLLAVQGAD